MKNRGWGRTGVGQTEAARAGGKQAAPVGKAGRRALGTRKGPGGWEEGGHGKGVLGGEVGAERGETGVALQAAWRGGHCIGEGSGESVAPKGLRSSGGPRPNRGQQKAVNRAEAPWPPPPSTPLLLRGKHPHQAQPHLTARYSPARRPLPIRLEVVKAGGNPAAGSWKEDLSEEETEAQRGEVTCLKSLSETGAELGCSPGVLTFSGL